jgi:hypothetical protein
MLTIWKEYHIWKKHVKDIIFLMKDQSNTYRSSPGYSRFTVCKSIFLGDGEG